MHALECGEYSIGHEAIVGESTIEVAGQRDIAHEESSSLSGE